MSAEKIFNNALELFEKGQYEEAIEQFTKVIELAPDNVGAFYNMGNAFLALKRYDEACDVYEKAIALHPTFADAYYNLGNALAEMDMHMDAAKNYVQAITINPGHYRAHNNLGNSCAALGRHDEAVECYYLATEAYPNDSVVQVNLALELLLLGHYEDGWDRYEWRWIDDPSTNRQFKENRWNGEALPNSTIFIHAEQGYGDTLQFLRYVPLVERLVKNVILEVPASMVSLALNSFPRVTVLGEGNVLPPFDVQCPLVSLPRVFGTNAATIPNTVPYLSVSDDLIKKWKLTGSELKIGFAWSGDVRDSRGWNRHMSFEQFLPLIDMPKTKWFSLQTGLKIDFSYFAQHRFENEMDGRVSFGDPTQNLIDFSTDIKTFADTAAIISNLDLVITVDTAVAHLAGALGKKVWTMLPFVPAWRWLLDRKDSPWYPTMTLFRQKVSGDWSTVIDDVKFELKSIIDFRP